MQRARYGLMVLLMTLMLATSAVAEVSIGIGIGLPNLRIGINLPVYPDLTPIPGYPVYYAPQMDANYFYYDGLYWVYQDDNWYASSWYNGPWGFVEPAYVPVYILRVPVAYYRHRPSSFRGWHSNEPPRWGQRWGRDWEKHRDGWDRWDRRSAPIRAPRPTYQRQYSGDRYPQPDHQDSLHYRNYRYQPHDKVVREHYQQKIQKKRTPAPVQQRRPEVQHNRDSRPQPAVRPQSAANPRHEEQAPKFKDRDGRKNQQDEKKSQEAKKHNEEEQKREDERGRDRRN